MSGTPSIDLIPFCAEDRVPDRVVVDVDRTRRPSGGDPPGETLAERDADALLDLLLDPERRARDELVRLLVEQEHRARVGAKDVADPRQEHREELVHLEVRERRVGDRLDVLDPLAGGALGLEEARVVDRERGAVGDELEQLDLVRRELAYDERADVEHAAAPSPSTTSGTPSIDLIPFSRRIGLRTSRVVDVVEDHRLLLGRDAAGEAAADGDADALLDLLLDPERRARDELVRLLVEQEDRARVDVEQLARADEQRVEQLVELEMRERGVRDRLQPPDVLRLSTPRSPSAGPAP